MAAFQGLANTPHSLWSLIRVHCARYDGGDTLLSRVEERLTMKLTIEVEQEADGRWLAEVLELAGVLTYGQSRDEAIARAQALALRVLADRLDHGESVPDLSRVFSVVA